MSLQPKHEINELAEQRQAIWRALTESFRVDEFSIKRLQKQFKELFKKTAFDRKKQALISHELAYLSAYLKRPEEAVLLIEQSIELGLPEIPARFSIGFVLWMNGQIMQGREVLASIGVQREDLNLVKSMIGCSLAMGMIDLANDCVQLLGRKEDSNVINASEMLSELGVSDIELTKRIQTAIDAIRDDLHHPLMAYDLFAMHGEGLLFQIVVNASVDKLVEMDIKIAEALTEHYHDPIDSVLTICTKPHASNATSTSYGPYHASM